MRAHIATFFALIAPVLGLSYSHMDADFLFEVGDPAAQTQVVEYMAFDCENCLSDLYRHEDFSQLFQDHIAMGEVHWTFHPDPSDLLTVQVMAGFEQVPEEKRWEGFWRVIKAFNEDHESDPLDLVKEIVTDLSGRVCAPLEDLDYLKSTRAFAAARDYLMQQGIVRTVPTVEINGKLYSEYPTFNGVQQEIKRLQQRELMTDRGGHVV